MMIPLFIIAATWPTAALAVTCADVNSKSNTPDMTDVDCFDFKRDDGSPGSVLVNKKHFINYEGKAPDQNQCGDSEFDEYPYEATPIADCENIQQWARDHAGLWDIQPKDLGKTPTITLIESGDCGFYVNFIYGQTEPGNYGFKVGNLDVSDTIQDTHSLRHEKDGTTGLRGRVLCNAPTTDGFAGTLRTKWWVLKPAAVPEVKWSKPGDVW
ncbi:hypothetical protein F4819DRAFT_482735 [Hypoxylon fuscum]|nr:hypothetical protein F4819DRAFT_482735 [Hypoxylon fuscum]